MIAGKTRLGLHHFMALPAALLFGVFFVFPLLRGLGMSLTEWNGMGKPTFIGIRNFIDFFRDARAIHDIQNTLLFALGSASLLNLVGLGYALLLNGEFPGKGAARLVVYIPAVISPLIMGYIWYFLLQPGRGYLARALFLIGKDGLVNGWMDQYWSVLMVLVLVNVWQYAGMTMVIYLAGLQAIPGELYESALIDGAGRRTSFSRITLPLLRPSIQINVVTNIIGSLSVFDIVMSLTEGGPGYSTETLSIYIMRMCYGSRTGYSTAVAVIMFFIILIPVLVSWHLTRIKEDGLA